MTIEKPARPRNTEASLAALAILKARKEVMDSNSIDPEAKQEAADLAQERILNELSDNDLRARTLTAMERALHLINGTTPAPSGIKLDLRPWPIPTHIPPAPRNVLCPDYPELGLDHPDARDIWEEAHLDLAKAQYMLEPKILRAYSENQLEIERWEARQLGRKPSGDLRHPVPRNRLSAIVKEIRSQQEKAIHSANRKITAISTGDVAYVSIEKLPGTRNRSGSTFPFLVLQSDLDQRAARKNMTDEQRDLERAKWEQIVDELVAELTPQVPEPAPPYLPDLPLDRTPTDKEVSDFVTAVHTHIDYLEKGQKIDDKKQEDARTKIRTQQRLEAEKADPEGTAAAKKELARQKAADRQRRYRERQKSQSIKK